VQPRVPQSEIRKLQRTGLSLIERAKVLHTPRQKEETMTWQQITAAYMPALMIMVTVYIAAVSNNKRIDDVNNRMALSTSASTNYGRISRKRSRLYGRK